MIRNEHFLSIARQLEPELILTEHRPESFHPAILSEGDRLQLDFGDHCTGHLRLKMGYTGSHPDAPLWLQIRFAEREKELTEDPQNYTGWISKGWIQTEQLHADILPDEITLPRRYAFRYVQIEVLAVSSKYSLVVEDAVCLAESSADENTLLPYEAYDPLLKQMDKTAVRTIHECMQKVFEDGPKRDRRLWLGDLRLQALADYQTYQNLDLVRRCLYLFAGCTQDNGRICAAIFTEPQVEADDVEMFDYSLLFIPTLLDYYKASGDMDTVRELWPAAFRQIELSQEQFDENGLIRDCDRLGWCFLDWNLELNKQAGAQGVYLYSLRAAEKLAYLLGDEECLAGIQADYDRKKSAARTYLWDERSRLFVSGEKCQRSLASQVWMLLGGVLESEEAKMLLRRLDREELVRPVTPYMMHYYTEAAMMYGERELALQILRNYWGGMVRSGADTFWELYDPSDPEASPYGGCIVNSYCHAWSCAPAYFLRKYQFGN